MSVISKSTSYDLFAIGYSNVMVISFQNQVNFMFVISKSTSYGVKCYMLIDNIIILFHYQVKLHNIVSFNIEYVTTHNLNMLQHIN